LAPTRAPIDGDPSHIVTVEFDLAGLEPAPHLDPEGS
jgi:hypothetical protein